MMGEEQERGGCVAGFAPRASTVITVAILFQIEHVYDDGGCVKQSKTQIGKHF